VQSIDEKITEEAYKKFEKSLPKELGGKLKKADVH